jgi:hypothetical protein
VVSHDEIKKKLADKREGKKLIKENLTGDRTPSSEEIKEKFKQKKDIQNENRRYLFCETCNGYYELQPGESASNFESCQCGGELKHIDTLDFIKHKLETK